MNIKSMSIKDRILYLWKKEYRIRQICDILGINPKRVFKVICECSKCGECKPLNFEIGLSSGNLIKNNNTVNNDNSTS